MKNLTDFTEDDLQLINQDNLEESNKSSKTKSLESSMYILFLLE